MAESAEDRKGKGVEKQKPTLFDLAKQMFDLRDALVDFEDEFWERYDENLGGVIKTPEAEADVAITIKELTELLAQTH